ncbi:porin [Burkholderia sp. Bp9015]|uniref:porin n=1 Tax=Burkholderia sp. Bp9015 TaxID=2184563 RepID=UPI000F59037A|nr:porin [Burkholderia sp. Bp9015]RQR74795.1 porin [Burkholderia sp. Bp9015]
MKRYLPLVAGVVAFGAASAHAQSSVTLYGIVDAGVNYVSNVAGHSMTSATSGTLSSSRWGLNGTEDLGGGLRAQFSLENGFDVMSGKAAQNGRLFGRHAYVGLVSDRYGSVLLGRQWDIFGDYLWQANASNRFGGVIATHPGDVDNLDSSYKTNNAVKYLSPSFNGFSFGGVYGFGNQAGSMSRNAMWSTGVHYQNRSLNLGAGYANFNRINTASMDGSGAAKGTLLVAPPVFSGYLSAERMEIYALGGTYQVGKWTLGGSFSHTRFSNLGSDAGPNRLHYHDDVLFFNGEVNALYAVTPSLYTGVVYHYTWSRPHDEQGGARYHQGGFTIDYSLSKRTDVYILAQYQHASGTDSLGESAVANLDGFSASNSSNQYVTRVGVRHRF